MKRKINNRETEDRYEYLQNLIKEFYTTSQLEAKKEVLANLSNFSYNPVNFIHFRQLNIVDVFLDVLNDENQDLQQFAVCGLCNIAADSINKGLIIEKGGIAKLSPFLSAANTDLVLPALAALVYLISPASISEIACGENKVAVEKLLESQDGRLHNLAKIFLEDICSYTGQP